MKIFVKKNCAPTTSLLRDLTLNAKSESLIRVVCEKFKKKNYYFINLHSKDFPSSIVYLRLADDFLRVFKI